MYNNTSFDIDGSFSFVMNDGVGQNNLRLILDNTSKMYVGIDDGALAESFTMTCTQGYTFYLDIDRDASLEIYGNTTMIHSGEQDMDIHLNENANGGSADGQLRIDGNWNITKDDGDAFEIHVHNQSNIDVGGDVIINTTAFDAGGGGYGILDIDGNGEMAVDGSLTWTFNSAQEENDLNIDLDNNGALYVGIDDGSLSKSFTINMLNGYDFDMDLDRDSKVEVYGDCNITSAAGSYLDIDLNANDNGTAEDGQLRIDGDFVITKSDGYRYRIRASNTSDIDVGGNFTYTGTNHKTGWWDDEAIRLNNNSTFDIDGEFTFLMNTDAQQNDLLIDLNGSSQFSLGSNATDNHTITMTDGDQMALRLDDAAIWNVYGNLNTVLANSNQPASLYLNSNSGSTAQLNITGNLDIDNNKNTDEFRLRLYATGSLLNVDGDIDLSSAATSNRIEIELSSSSKIEIGGDFLRTGGFGELDCNGTSTVEYNGTVGTQNFAQDAGAGTDYFDYHNVIINNSYGTTPQITMEGLATVHGGINFTDGVISSSKTNLLVIDNGASTTGASDESYVDGYVRKIGRNPSAEFTSTPEGYAFPIGAANNSGVNKYAPCYITRPSATTDQFDANFIHANSHFVGYDSTLKDMSIDHISKKEYWVIDRVNGTSTVFVTLSWDDLRSGGVTTVSDMTIAGWNGAVWKDLGNGLTSGNTTKGTVSSAGVVTAFGSFTLGSTSTNNPLPVELLSFEANLNKNKVDLKWITAAEVNNDYFTVERSLDARVWEETIIVNGAGNSNKTLMYFETDFFPITGISYYRLKQTDFDGEFLYSDIVTVKFETSEVVGGTLILYPNPVSVEGTKNVNVINRFNSEVVVVLKDIIGREIYSIKIDKGELIELPIKKGLPAGVYIVTALSGSEMYSQKLIIK